MKLFDKKYHNFTSKYRDMKFRISYKYLTKSEKGWSISCSPEGDEGRAYVLSISNDGTGKPEFERHIWEEGEQRLVVTKDEYESYSDPETGLPVSNPPKHWIVDEWIDYPTAFEAMRLRWEALNMLAEFSLS